MIGGRIDDLSLRQYRETLDEDSPIVRLLSPVGGEEPYYALYGWAPGGDLGFDQVPGANTEWSVESGEILTPETPVTLVWENGSGLVFRRTIAIDENFMFSVTQSVENTGAGAARLAPYGIVARHGLPDDLQNFFILHEGVVRKSDGQLDEIAYDDVPDLDFVQREAAAAEIVEVEADGWIGFTDKYWMTTLIPGADQPFTSVTKYVAAADIYQTEARLPAMTVEAGQRVEVTTQLFAGAKEWETIRNYQNEGGIERFLDSIDWGWFYFLTKPIFWLLHNLNVLIGNMGLAIIALTVIIKAALFPLAYKSYASMARMRELQPQMEKDQGARGRRPPEDAAGDDGTLQAGKGEPRFGWPSHLVADPDLLLALQGDFRHAGIAPTRPSSAGCRTCRRLTPRRSSTSSASCHGTRPEPTSLLALIFIGNPADPPGHLDVGCSKS